MKIIKLHEGERFRDIMPLIPSNHIINKKIPGLGATYAEIKAPRHSIILEPNVPVITIKCANPIHIGDNLFGVYKKVPPFTVRTYISGSLRQGKYIKLMVTPESFWKIKKAFSELGLDIYSECFLLFDECQKIVQDVDYREDITLPFEDFLLFRNKALLSATPVYMSDPRLKDFIYMEFKPVYPITVPVTLHPTNNILESLKRTISYLADQEVPLCLFINSTDMIFSIIEALEIQEETSVFCAPKSVEQLNYKGFEFAYPDFIPDRMKRYNFFTSRFFCALDIELGVRPNLIAVTDVKRIAHTILHPETDLWQIIGRFRSGVTDVYHITNFDEHLEENTREGLRMQIDTMEGAYKVCQLHYESATNRNVRIGLADILKGNSYKQFLISPDDSPYKDVKSWFKIDNYINERLTLSLYHDFRKLKAAYENTGLYHITEVTNGFYREEENFGKLFLSSKSITMREKRRYIVNCLLNMEKWNASQFKRKWSNRLYQTEPFIVKAYEILGVEVIERLKYSQRKIREAMILKEYEQRKQCTAFTELLKNSFMTGRKYKVSQIKNMVLDIYRKLDIPPLRSITAKSLMDYFEVTETWMGKKEKRERAYYIVRAKF